MYIWWGILIIGSSFLLKERFKIIQTGTLTTFDSIAIAVFIVLALIPFFSEMSFLGLTIKKDISELKKDVKEEIKEIKHYIINAVDVNNRLNTSINIGQPVVPPPDEQLNKLEERFRVIIRDTLAEKGIRNVPQLVKDFDVPENNRLLFSARYLIEKELRRIWKSRFEPEADSRRVYPISRMVDELVKNQILPLNLGGIIKDVVPELVGSLREIL